MRSKRYIVLILAAVLTASTIAISFGNEETAPGQNKECSNDNQCSESQVCADGSCIAGSNEAIAEEQSVQEEDSAPDNSGSAPGQDESASDQGVSTLDQSISPLGRPTPGCVADTDCTGGQICKRGVCVTPCSNNGDCSGGNVCKQGVCANDRTYCGSDNNDCTNDYKVKGKCYTPTNEDGSCASDAGMCSGGSCECDQANAPVCTTETWDSASNTCTPTPASDWTYCGDGSGFEYCCGGICIDTATSNDHCGSCSNVCDQNKLFSCQNSQCLCQNNNDPCNGVCCDTDQTCSWDDTFTNRICCSTDQLMGSMCCASTRYPDSDHCEPNHCNDNSIDGGETGVDCGGNPWGLTTGCTARCSAGQGCSTNGDCISGTCNEGTCT